MLKFDGRVVPRGAEPYKCGLHEGTTIPATSEHVQCVLSIISFVERLRHSTAELYQKGR